MSDTVIATAAAHFGRDLAFDLDRIESIVARAKAVGAALLVLPDAALGGYLTTLRGDADEADLPPGLRRDDPVFDRIRRLADSLTVCVGFRELADDGRHYNAAVAIHGDGVLGRHRKVHQPPGELPAYSAGTSFTAFDTPVGRMGMIIDYDKTFPESTRCLVSDGADLVAALSAWPASITGRAARLAADRQTRLFDIYDCARAAENQVVLVSSNLTGRSGELRFLGNAKIVGPGGDILARTGATGGLATAAVDIAGEVARARQVLWHVKERQPSAYRA